MIFVDHNRGSVEHIVFLCGGYSHFIPKRISLILGSSYAGCHACDRLADFGSLCIEVGKGLLLLTNLRPLLRGFRLDCLNIRVT